MDYYHLVTRKSMYLGQIIDFSNGEHNRLYEFWMTREERNAEGRDAFDILEKKDINADNLDVISGYVFNQSRAVRETIAELVRVKEFPNLPSRFSLKKIHYGHVIRVETAGQEMKMATKYI